MKKNNNNKNNLEIYPTCGLMIILKIGELLKSEK